MIERALYTEETVTADTDPIDLLDGRLTGESPDSLPPDESIRYIFEGDNVNEVRLTSEKSGSTGLLVPKGDRFMIGDFRARSGGAFRYLYASESTNITVTALVVSGGQGHVYSPISDDIDIDEIYADIQTEGTYNEQPQTIQDGERGDIQLDEVGNQRVASKPLDFEAEETGLSATSDWEWRVYESDYPWVVRAMTIFFQETSGGDNFKYQIYGTTQNNPATPTGSDPDDWYDLNDGESTVGGGEEKVVKHTGRNSKKVAIGIQDPNSSAQVDYQAVFLANPGTDELVRRIRDIYVSENVETVAVEEQRVEKINSGAQTVTANSEESQPINPSSNGVNGDLAEITIKNTGDTDIWVRFDSSLNESGLLLSPGEGKIYENHTSVDGDLHVYFQASTGGQANCEFLEYTG